MSSVVDTRNSPNLAVHEEKLHQQLKVLPSSARAQRICVCDFVEVILMRLPSEARSFVTH